jgi:hypothetical protein
MAGSVPAVGEMVVILDMQVLLASEVRTAARTLRRRWLSYG